MPHQLNVYALPRLAEPDELVGGAVVVIDVLRSSTTIVHALEAGAEEVIPCRTIEEARAIAQELPDQKALLGGERGGLPIDGFDLGNSPGEYIPERVAGKVVVLTTTNGTQAIAATRAADRVLIGAFVNANAVVSELVRHEQIHLLCAGTDGQISDDDVLLAGMLVERIQREGGLVYQQNAQAMTARETWLHSFALPRALGAEPLEPERLAEKLRATLGGRHLVELGLEDDVLAAAQVDRFRDVAELDPVRIRIRLV